MVHVPERFDSDDVNRLRTALARIARRLDRQTRRATLTHTELSVLATLECRGPLRAGELAEIEGVNQTMLSRIVGKLAEAGLVERTPDPADARAVLLAVTPAGGDLHRRLRAERTRLLAEHLATLPDTETTRLMAALPALEALATALATTPQEQHR
ncbi:DNA-binding transcriptional regulator, MarR family [Pseudonocardia thermophila]|uniref:DNA-binding transcriptional regulator, MarR family n=1 Tax=Pseudonocardia thermophila TaxID=1848 RepID=A0A1M6UIA7_PSETH|nr:DNA-binding transcriptional regulator, MarR family [Pseudonocardia thermophila]